MKVCKSFLNDFVKVDDIDTLELASKMVFAGNEYESITKISDATGLVVGEVLECIDHPNSDHLHICRVNLGEEIVQIICGAPNVRSGIKVIVAIIGAVLPGNFVIKKAVLAGEESSGMICSLAELGLESKYLTDADKDGIHVLEDEAVVGDDAIHYLGYDDETIDFELTSNRADLMSYLGMAYEVGAIYGREVIYPQSTLTESSDNINDIYKIDVKTDKCPIYLGKLVKGVKIGESPKFIKNRLIASGIRPINNVVDISNYVMLELGGPLHFFDADRLGNTVIVREALDDEKIITLDGIERTLKNSDIVIANQNEIVALAGVMGGKSSEVESDTVNIFIESAIFNSISIRLTSKRFLRSEASNRFEKGIDPSRVELALNRAAYLLEKYAGGSVAHGILKHDTVNKDDKKIDIDLDKINGVLGMNLTVDDVKKVFDNLVFKYSVNGNTFSVSVPTRRLDVNIKEDLIEEVGRIHGYDKVTGILPTVAIKKGSYKPKEILTKNIRKRLEGMGLNQVITYSLVGDKEIDIFKDKEVDTVTLLSPMSEDKKYMRRAIIPSLLNVFDYNVSRNIKDILIYETGSIYINIGTEYKEESKVSGLLYGNYIVNNWNGSTVKVDFYVLKGIIENLLTYLGLANRYSFSSDNADSDLHPGRSASIKVDGEVVGYMGQVHPKISKKEIYVFEISIDLLFNKKVRSIKYKEVSKYPSVHKDVAFVMNKDVTNETVMSVIKKVGGRLLREIDVFDLYVGENVGADEKSIAYSLVFEDQAKTLTDEEVTTLFNKIIEEVESKTGSKLRNK